MASEDTCCGDGLGPYLLGSNAISRWTGSEQVELQDALPVSRAPLAGDVGHHPHPRQNCRVSMCTQIPWKILLSADPDVAGPGRAEDLCVSEELFGAADVRPGVGRGRQGGRPRAAEEGLQRWPEPAAVRGRRYTDVVSPGEGEEKKPWPRPQPLGPPEARSPAEAAGGVRP